MTGKNNRKPYFLVVIKKTGTIILTNYYCRDGSGYLDVSEVRQAFNDAGHKITGHECRELLSKSHGLNSLLNLSNSDIKGEAVYLNIIL